MKSFLEEYGIVIVVAVVIFGLIVTSIFFRDTGGDSLKGFLNNFQDKAELIETADATPAPVIQTTTYSDMNGHDITIQYEEGMTWREWLSSSYGSAYSYDNIYHELILWQHPNDATVTVTLHVQPEDVITTGIVACYNCFVAGTQVTYDFKGHTKSIEDFKPGDDVVSYNLDTKEFYIAKVVDVARHESEAELETTLAEVVFDNGSTLNMTLDHEILTTKGGRSVRNVKDPDRELKVGDIAVTGNGLATVTYINIYDCEPTPTYCLCVMDEEEIIAGIDDDRSDNFLAEGIVVHNVGNDDDFDDEDVDFDDEDDNVTNYDEPDPYGF